MTSILDIRLQIRCQQESRTNSTKGSVGDFGFAQESDNNSRDVDKK
jgi:hypothetical protein